MARGQSSLWCDVFGHHHFVWAQFTGQSSLWSTAAAIEEAADGLEKFTAVAVGGFKLGNAYIHVNIYSQHKHVAPTHRLINANGAGK